MSQSATLDVESGVAASQPSMPSYRPARESKPNVGVMERIASTAAGGILVARGMRRPTVVSVAGVLLGADLVYRGVSGHSRLYDMLGVNTAENRRPGSEISTKAPELRRSITIGRSPEELYGFWRNPERLARLVSFFAEVTPRGEGLLHWRMTGPLRQSLEWTSRYVEEQPGRKLAWQSVPGGNLVNRGEIVFSPAPNAVGTEVQLWMQFEPPLGAVGVELAKLMRGLPRGVAGQTLRRFKSLVETGEIPSLVHNPSGRGLHDRF